MNARRAFLQTSLGVVAGAAAMTSGRHAKAETKPALTSPKVVSDDEGTKVWAMGVLVTVKVKAEDTGGAYSVFEDLIPPGAGPVPHTHTKEDETIFVIEGELRAWLGGKQYDVKAGDFVHMPRGVEHYFKREPLMTVMQCEGATANPFLRLRLGQCLFELAELEEAANWLNGAFLQEGTKIFANDDPKYLAFIKSKLLPPPGGWPEGW